MIAKLLLKLFSSFPDPYGKSFTEWRDKSPFQRARLTFWFHYSEWYDELEFFLEDRFEWWSEKKLNFIKLLFTKIICPQRGHGPMYPDMCMRPEHDQCSGCEAQREWIENNGQKIWNDDWRKYYELRKENERTTRPDS